MKWLYEILRYGRYVKTSSRDGRMTFIHDRLTGHSTLEWKFPE